MIFWKVVFDHLKGLFTQNCFIVYSSSCPNLTFFCETHIKIFGRMLGTKEFLWPLNWKTCLCSSEESQPCGEVFPLQWRNKLINYHILWCIDGETNQLLVTVCWNSSMVAPLLFKPCQFNNVRLWHHMRLINWSQLMSELYGWL